MMTNSERTRLRQLIDEAVRHRIKNTPRLVYLFECKGCGTERHEWTLGCGTCRDRHYGYMKRRRYPRGKAWYLDRHAAHAEWMKKHTGRSGGNHGGGGKGKRPTVPGRVTYTAPRKEAT